MNSKIATSIFTVLVFSGIITFVVVHNNSLEKESTVTNSSQTTTTTTTTVSTTTTTAPLQRGEKSAKYFYEATQASSNLNGTWSTLKRTDPDLAYRLIELVNSNHALCLIASINKEDAIKIVHDNTISTYPHWPYVYSESYVNIFVNDVC